jgi:hypothetical protein
VLPHALDILHHVIQGVPSRVFEALRAARSALIDQHQSTAPRQWLERWKKVRVIGAGAAMQQQQWYASAESLVVDPCAGAGDEAFAGSQCG